MHAGLRAERGMFMLNTNSGSKMNRKQRRESKVQIINGQIVKEQVKVEKAPVREQNNLSIIVNQIKNRKRVSKTKALKLGKICVNNLLGEGKDKTSFMSMAYSETPGQVGKITNVMSTICSITRESWENEDGTINKDLFYNAFACADKKNPGHKDHWDTIFKEGTPSVTKGVSLSHYVEMAYDIYYISNVEIAAFKNQMMEIDPDKITYEDIVKIQADLYHLFRAFQESSIDVTKDKDKDYVTKYDEIVGYVPRKYTKNPDNYRHNITEVLRSKDVTYEIEINTKDNYAITRSDILCDALAETHENFITKEVIATAEDTITDLMRSVIGTSACLSTEDKLHCESIISTVSASFQSDIKLDRDEYKACRNALYTICADYTEDPDDATAMILDMIIARYHLTYEGKLERNNDVSKIRLGVAKMVLGGILPLYLNSRKSYTIEFGPKDYTLFQELEEGQRFEISDGDIIADGILVGCLNITEDEDRICEIETDAAYVIDDVLYVEMDMYADLDCDVQSVVIEQLYVAGSTANDIKAGNADDAYGKDTYNDMLNNTMAITGRRHNVLTLEDCNGIRSIRGKLNTHSAALLEGQNTLEITAENSIAIHIPFDSEVDKYQYGCEVVVFC